jgi:hypothetical protein
MAPPHPGGHNFKKLDFVPSQKAFMYIWPFWSSGSWDLELFTLHKHM